MAGKVGTPSLRPMTLADVPAAWAIQIRAYADPSLHEEACHFERRLEAYPQGCWVAEATFPTDVGDESTVMVGYLVSYPSMLDDPPALSSGEWEVPTGPDAYFIHEVTIDPCRQGMGLGRLLAAKASECARSSGVNADYVALISVQGSSPFWNRHGGYVPYDFERNRLLTRLPDATKHQHAEDGADAGPQLYDEDTARKLKDKLARSYGPEAMMMLAPMPN